MDITEIHRKHGDVKVILHNKAVEKSMYTLKLDLIPYFKIKGDMTYET